MSVLYKALQKAAKEHEQREAAVAGDTPAPAAPEVPPSADQPAADMTAPVMDTPTEPEYAVAEPNMPEADTSAPSPLTIEDTPPPPAPEPPPVQETAPPPPQAPVQAPADEDDDPADKWGAAPMTAPAAAGGAFAENRKAILAGAALGLLLIIGGVAWFLLSGGDDRTPIQVAQTQPTPQPTTDAAPGGAIPGQMEQASAQAGMIDTPMIAERPVEDAPATVEDTPASTDVFEPADISPPGSETASATTTRPAAPVQTAQAAPPRAAPSAMRQQTAAAPLDRHDEANLLNPPISIKRADAALAGVGNAVQVREVAQAAQDNVATAYGALLDGRYSTALGFYDRALADEPNSMLARLGRAAALQKLGRTQEAQQAYMDVLARDKNNVEALTNLTGIIAERAPGEAFGRLQELERAYPYFSPIKAQLGMISAANGNDTRAVSYLREAVSMAPDNVMYKYNLAVLLDRMGRADQAVAVYSDVLAALRSGNGPASMDRTSLERRVAYLRTR